MVENEYAKALYELAVEEDKVNTYSDCLLTVVDTYEVEDLNKVLNSPFISSLDKKNIIKEVYKGFDKTFLGFINVLIDNNRFSKIKEIYETYKKIILDNNDIIKVDVYSVTTLSTSQLNNIEKALKEKYNYKNLMINNIVDQELIGGIKIIADGDVIDISVKSSLNRLKESL